MYYLYAWDDWRNGTKDISLQRALTLVDFSTNRIVNDGANSSGLFFLCMKNQGIAVADGKAYVIWTDYRNTQLPTTVSPNDVFFAVEQCRVGHHAHSEHGPQNSK